MKKSLSPKTIERLSQYRRFLKTLSKSEENIYSHQLGEKCHSTSNTVRRDLMLLGHSGNPRHGYDIKELVNCLDELFNANQDINVAIVGLGNIAHALISYFSSLDIQFNIVAGFDTDQSKIDNKIENCYCYSMAALSAVVKQENITMAIISVPRNVAQEVAEELVKTGVNTILNFAPVRLQLPKEVYVEDIDITMLLEKAYYFGKNNNLEKDIDETYDDE